MAATGSRPLRADARRNRDRLVEAAVTVFSRDSRGATLEAVAKEAGVGIGTLYRHFPTREALVEAAYRNELTRLCDAAGELLATTPPDAALRAWMDRFVDYMTTKRGMSSALRAVIASGGDPYAHTRERLCDAVHLLLTAGARAGTVRPDVQTEDVLAAIAGVSLVTVEPPRPGMAGRLLDLLMDGLRPRPGVPAAPGDAPDPDPDPDPAPAPAPDRGPSSPPR